MEIVLLVNSPIVTKSLTGFHNSLLEMHELENNKYKYTYIIILRSFKIQQSYYISTI